MSGRPILITGANGQLGRRLIRRLHEASRPARALVRSKRAADSIAPLCEQTGASCHVVDYGDAEGLTAAAEGGDAVVHLVGILKATRSNSYEDAHEDASTALARAADAAGLRRVVALSILGSRADSDNACLASKGRSEDILLAARTPAVIIRVPMVLGAGDPAAQALARQASAGTTRLVRGGATREQPIAANDVVNAILGALDMEEDGVALDLAGPESLPHRELVVRTAALLGKQVTFGNIPLPLARAFAFVASKLAADPPITPAMLGVLEHDDDIDPAPAASALGIELTPLDDALKIALDEEHA